MEIPQALWRFPTAEAISGLIRRLQFVTHAHMQDPECELADPSRIEEFLTAYESSGLSDDEKFLLMAIMLNSFESSDAPPTTHPQWKRTLELLDSDISIHIFSVLYFSDPVDDWSIGPDLRILVSKHGAAFGLAA